MKEQKHRWEQGWTVIELIAVMAIIGILVTLAISTYFNLIGQYRLTNESRVLSHTLQDARLRSISTGIAHGVAFERRTFPQPDRYFIFMDCAAQSGSTVSSTGDLVYTDPDGDFTNNSPITELNECNTVTYDPRARNAGVVELAPRNSLGQIIGWSQPGDTNPTAPLEYVTFNTTGQLMRGNQLAVGPGGVTEITIERVLENNNLYEAGVTISPGTGLSYTFAIRRQQ